MPNVYLLLTDITQPILHLPRSYCTKLKTIEVPEAPGGYFDSASPILRKIVKSNFVFSRGRRWGVAQVTQIQSDALKSILIRF